MSKQYTFEREQLKTLVKLFLDNNGQFNENYPEEAKKAMKLFFYDTIPMVQLGDGFNFIEAVFTKEAANSFRKNYSHLRLGQMRDRLLKLTEWSLQMK